MKHLKVNDSVVVKTAKLKIIGISKTLPLMSGETLYLLAKGKKIISINKNQIKG